MGRESLGRARQRLLALRPEAAVADRTRCANRTVADVSAVADPATGAAVYWLQRGLGRRRRHQSVEPIIAAYDALTGAAASPSTHTRTSADFDHVRQQRILRHLPVRRRHGYDGRPASAPRTVGNPGASTAATDRQRRDRQHGDAHRQRTVRTECDDLLLPVRHDRLLRLGHRDSGRRFGPHPARRPGPRRRACCSARADPASVSTPRACLASVLEPASCSPWGRYRHRRPARCDHGDGRSPPATPVAYMNPNSEGGSLHHRLALALMCSVKCAAGRRAAADRKCVTFTPSAAAYAHVQRRTPAVGCCDQQGAVPLGRETGSTPACARSSVLP